jgi:hypothetical protein
VRFCALSRAELGSTTGTTGSRLSAALVRLAAARQGPPQ